MILEESLIWGLFAGASGSGDQTELKRVGCQH